MGLQPHRAKLRSRSKHAGFLRVVIGVGGIGSTRPGCRMLGDDGERQRFGKSHVFGRLAKVNPACGSNTFDVAAERRKIQIGLDQFPFRVTRLKPQCGSDLMQLTCRCSGVQMVGHPGDLHCQCGTTGASWPAPCAESGSNNRDWIDSGMPVEPAVLLQKKCTDKFRRHPGQWSP